MITFIVLTYNQSNYIIDCLNSIKFQINNYGANHDFQLIVCDDCSNDHSVLKIKDWVKKNNKYFFSSKIIARSKNLGTCGNYKDALRYVIGDKVKAIAGDDLLPPNNIIQIMELLDEFDVVYGIPFIYQSEGNQIEVNYKEYISNYCYEMGNISKDFKTRISRSCFLNGPATYVSKELLLNESVLEFMGEYKYVDDYSQWFMYTKIKNLKVKFINEYLIIYRRTSLSAFIVRNKELQTEKIKIFNYIRHNTRNLTSKCYQLNNILVAKLNHPFFQKFLTYENYKLFFFKKRFKADIDTIQITKKINIITNYIENEIRGINKK